MDIRKEMNSCASAKHNHPNKEVLKTICKTLDEYPAYKAPTNNIVTDIGVVAGTAFIMCELFKSDEEE